MKRESLIFRLLLILGAAMLTGCPNTPNIDGTNSVTVHNNYDYDIFFLSVTRIGPIDPVKVVVGINLLPEPIQPGETFRVDNLEDGKYDLYLSYYYTAEGNASSRAATQSLEGGNNYDWYFTGPKNLNSDEPLEPSAPTAKAILNELLGL